MNLFIFIPLNFDFFYFFNYFNTDIFKNIYFYFLNIFFLKMSDDNYNDFEKSDEEKVISEFRVSNFYFCKFSLFLFKNKGNYIFFI